MAQKVPEDGWTMQDGTPWPGNNVRDHPGMIQVLLVLSSKILLDMFFFTRIFGRSRNSKFVFTNRFSLVIMVSVILKEMSCPVLYMFLVRKDQALNTTRKLEL